VPGTDLDFAETGECVRVHEREITVLSVTTKG
jgi:hypothetical protein